MSLHAASSVMREEVVCRHCRREHAEETVAARGHGRRWWRFGKRSCRRCRKTEVIVAFLVNPVRHPRECTKKTVQRPKSNRKLVGTSNSSFKKKKYDRVKLKETLLTPL